MKRRRLFENFRPPLPRCARADESGGGLFGRNSVRLAGAGYERAAEAQEQNETAKEFPPAERKLPLRTLAANVSLWTRTDPGGRGRNQRRYPCGASWQLSRGCRPSRASRLCDTGIDSSAKVGPAAMLVVKHVQSIHDSESRGRFWRNIRHGTLCDTRVARSWPAGPRPDGRAVRIGARHRRSPAARRVLSRAGQTCAAALHTKGVGRARRVRAQAPQSRGGQSHCLKPTARFNELAMNSMNWASPKF